MSRDFSTVVDDFASEKPSTSTPALHFDIKRFLNLRLPAVVIIGTLLAIPLAMAGWFLTPVEYTANATIQYRSPSSGIVTADRSNSSDYNKFVSTEIAKLTGDNVLIEVLKRPEITNLPSIRMVRDQLTFLKNRLNARLLPGSELVNVTCTMETREQALQVLQVVIDIYEDEAIREEQSEGNEKLLVLNEQIDNLRVKLQQQRLDIQDKEGAIAAISGGVLPEDSIEAEQYRASMLESEKAVKTAENEVAGVEDQIARVEAQIESNRSNPEQDIYEFSVESQIAQDPRVAALQEDLVRLETAVDMLRETHKDNHPELRSQLRQLESLKKSLAAEESIARGRALKEVRSQLLESLEAAKRRVEDERENLAQNTERLQEHVLVGRNNLERASSSVAELQQLREQASLDSQLLSDWQTKAQNLRLEMNTPPRVVIATQPYAPQTQGIAKKFMMAALGMIAGLGIGLAFGILRELFDQQIRTPRDITRISKLPIIASVPHMSEDRMLKDADNALLMAQHPNSIIADEYRRILARILFPEDNAAEISSLLIVSSSPGEGKTSIACNVAVALEHANRKVLLIDLSSQHPCIEGNFGLKPAAGLSDLLESDISPEEFIRRTAFENLGLLGPGSDPSELAGRLASREMMDFMEWADEHFDHIIVDSPPLLLMSDAKLLAPAIDGVLFVVGAGKSTLGMVSRCLRELEFLRANTIGIVLNGIRSMRGGYLRQNQNLFYAHTDRNGYEGDVNSMPEINIIEDDDHESVEAEVMLLPADKSEK